MAFRKWLRAAFHLPCLPTQAVKKPERSARGRAAQPVARPPPSPAPRISMTFEKSDDGLDIWNSLTKGARQDGSPSRLFEGCGASSGARGPSVPAQEHASDMSVPARTEALPRTGSGAAPRSGPVSSVPAAARRDPSRRARGASRGAGGEATPSTQELARLSRRMRQRRRQSTSAADRRRRLSIPSTILEAPRVRLRTEARTQTQRQRRLRASDDSRAGRRAEPPLAPLSRANVRSAVDAVDKLIPHLPFAVCGRAAMVYYGHRGRLPSYVCITCPKSAAVMLVDCARESGLQLSTRFPQAFYVPLHAAAPPRVSCCVRVLACDDFEGLARVRRGPLSTPVVALPHLAHRMARDLAREFGDALARDGGARDEGLAERAAELVWLLRRMAELGGEEHRLTLDLAPDFGRAAFLEPFGRVCPEAASLMRGAGLDVGSLPGFEKSGHAPPPAVPEPEKQRQRSAWTSPKPGRPHPRSGRGSNSDSPATTPQPSRPRPRSPAPPPLHCRALPGSWVTASYDGGARQDSPAASGNKDCAVRGPSSTLDGRAGGIRSMTVEQRGEMV